MTQAEMERELAAVTGESVETIRRYGFQHVETPDPHVVDWDAVHAERLSYLPQRSRNVRRQAA